MRVHASFSCANIQGVLNTFCATISKAASQFAKLINKVSRFATNLFQHIFCYGTPSSSKVVKVEQILGEMTIRAMIKDLFAGKTISEEHRLSAVHAKKALSHYFNSGLVGEIFSLYQLQNRNVMTVVELKAAIVGIQANMTLEALHTVYEHRNELGLNSPSLDTESDKLTQSQLITFLANVREKTIKPTKKQLSCKVQLKRDRAFLEHLKRISFFQPSSSNQNQDKAFEKFRFAEFLARVVVSNLMPATSAGFVDGVLFPVYDYRVGKEPILLEAHASMRHRGLHAINVIPAVPVSSSTFEKYGFMGATVFRGTKLTDLWTISRDLDLITKIRMLTLKSGPGYGDFPARENELRATIHRDIQKLRRKLNMHEYVPLPLSWDLIGHSLGGTDAQRMALALSKGGAELFKRLSVWTFNAPRIERNGAADFLQRVKKYPSTQFRLYHARTDGDAVQAVGDVLQGHFTADKQHPDNLATTVASFNVQEEGRKARHSAYTTTGKKKDGKDNGTYVTHLASNDPEFDGVKYGKTQEKQFTPDATALQTRLNKARTPQDHQNS